MSTPISAMTHSAARLPTPVIVQVVSGFSERGDHPVDFAVEGGYGGFEVGEVVQAEPDEQSVVLPESTPQRLLQLGNLLAQRPFGQFGEDLGIPLAVDQGPEHEPS
jgi:hypothetical protein